jgi:hypothetical protein
MSAATKSRALVVALALALLSLAVVRLARATGIGWRGNPATTSTGTGSSVVDSTVTGAGATTTAVVPYPGSDMSVGLMIVCTTRITATGGSSTSIDDTYSTISWAAAKWISGTPSVFGAIRIAATGDTSLSATGSPTVSTSGQAVTVSCPLDAELTGTPVADVITDVTWN